MKTTIIRSNKLYTLASVMPLMLLIACQDNASTSDVEVQAPINESAQSDTMPNTPETSAPQETTTDTSASTNSTDFSEFIALLQGSWERTTYPNGTVEFDGNQIKITAGEGAVEPAKFEAFRVSDTCPTGIDGEYSAQAYDFLVVADERCNAIKITDNKLSFTFAGANEAIQYKRMGESSAAAAAALNTIPSNFYGKWAMGQENCKANSLQQIQINANEINFYENKAELVSITQFEPTRIEANFNNMMKNDDIMPFVYTLDLKNQQKVLIMRENGDNARTGPLKYEKCA